MQYNPLRLALLLGAFCLAFAASPVAVAQDDAAAAVPDAVKAVPDPATDPAPKAKLPPRPGYEDEDPGTAGGRDIEPARPLHVIWRELVEIRNQLYVIVDGRDLRAVVLTPEEQSLIVAFSKRAFDLCEEFDALTYERLEGNIFYYDIRTSIRFLQQELSEVRSVGAGPIHRFLPQILTQLTIRLRGLYLAHPDHAKLLGSIGLPGKTHEDETVALPVYPNPELKEAESAPSAAPARTPSS